MTEKHLHGFGLFLATCAALALGFGLPQAARADGQAGETHVAAKSIPGTAGRAELARTKLLARLLAQGYTREEAKERLAFLSDDEVARFARDPNATTDGKIGFFVFGLLIAALVTLAVSWYFVAIEEPIEESPVPEPQPKPEPSPLPAPKSPAGGK